MNRGRAVRLAFIALSFFVGTIWLFASDDSQSITSQKMSEQYYFWSTNGPEGNIRQRLAKYFPYDPNARWNRNLIQTWHSQVNASTHGWFGTWDKHLPDFNHYLYLNNNTEIEYVQSINLQTNLLPDVVRAYVDLLSVTILRCDFFRYIAIWLQGGIWADMDTFVQQPFDNWLTGVAFNPTQPSPPIEELERKIGMVVGIEYWGPPDAIMLVDHKRWQFAQHLFGAKQGHPVLLEAIARVVEKAGDLANRIEEGTLSEDDVIVWTGPQLLTRVLEEWIRKRYDASFNYRHDLPKIKHPTLIGDILILPHVAFDAFPGTGEAARDPRKYAGHSNQGTWRKSKQT